MRWPQDASLETGSELAESLVGLEPVHTRLAHGHIGEASHKGRRQSLSSYPPTASARAITSIWELHLREAGRQDENVKINYGQSPDIMTCSHYQTGVVFAFIAIVFSLVNSNRYSVPYHVKFVP